MRNLDLGEIDIGRRDGSYSNQNPWIIYSEIVLVISILLRSLTLWLTWIAMQTGNAIEMNPLLTAGVHEFGYIAYGVLWAFVYVLFFIFLYYFIYLKGFSAKIVFLIISLILISVCFDFLHDLIVLPSLGVKI